MKNIVKTEVIQPLMNVARRYSTMPEYATFASAFVLLLAARQGIRFPLPNLDAILDEAEDIPLYVRSFIEETIGGHWREYQQAVGAFDEESLSDFFAVESVALLMSAREDVSVHPVIDTLCAALLDIKKGDEVFINAISEWVIIDATSRTLRKVETTSYPNDIDWIQEKSIEEKFRRFKDDFTEEDFIYKRLVRSGDIDVTHHTNNVTYITMLLDTFSVKELESKLWEDVEVSYLNESFEGETLSIYRKEREDGYSFSIKKEDGKVVLMAFFKN